MSLKTDLETNIRASYDLIRRFEEIVRLSDNPKEQARSEHAIKDQLKHVRQYLVEYGRLCSYLKIDAPQEINEIAVIVHARFPSSAPPPSSSDVPMSTHDAPVQLFYSYSHKDE